MADRSISVSLDFTANTNQAETALKSLQSSLQNISNMSTIGQDARMAKNIEEASAAAMTLRNNLQAAFDQKTGSLNLSKLNEEMAKSGMSAEKYRTTLSAIGPQGRQAFMELANAVVASETPLKQTTGLVDKLWDSLKRTAGWQLSSSVIHGFMGAIQSAYGYAQDLNKSLNNIRIVTGYSTDEMAQFAEQANKAAKGLSATTTDYTDAALIYYQQGIRDQSEIEGRVATTIKLANVSGQSAEEVSSQMTAIWNNFDDGSKSLEYYADVITALGAATASSSQEISQGLSKFAAVADTVGMSYEYATSALATIVATTRQSAETVGTGLRTLFSRLQGLKLGETLEDGVDLNKYSKALEAVGVKALDASGELRNMDEILDDLGERWGDLSQAQKVALAQTVGGVRQYTNLVALMDNWDFMKENVGIAEGAEGTLQEQADIYAESWEAAQKRVRAAAESIYSDLLKDDFFIDITKLFAGILETVDQLIDAFGGLGGILPLILTIMNKIFGEKMQAGAQRIAENLYYSTSKGKQERIDQDKATKQQFVDQTKAMQKEGAGVNEAAATEAGYNKITALQSEMIEKDEKLTNIERELYKMAIDRAQALTKQTAELGKQADEDRAIADAQKFDLLTGTDNTNANGELIDNTFLQMKQNFHDPSISLSSMAPELESLMGLEEGAIQTTEQFIETYEQFNNLHLTGTLSNDLDQIIIKNNELAQGQYVYQEIEQELKKVDSLSLEDARAELERLAKQAGVAGDQIRDKLASYTSINKIKQGFIELGASVTKSNSNIQKTITKTGQVIGKAYGFSEAEIEKFIQTTLKAAQSEKISAEGAEQLKKSLQSLSTSAGQAGNNIQSTSQKISNILGAASKFGQVAMNVSMLISSAKGLANAFTAPDMSPWERISSIFMSLSMLIPSFIGIWNGLQAAYTAVTASLHGLTLAEGISIAIHQKKMTAILTEKAGMIALALANETLTQKEKIGTIVRILSKAGLDADIAAKIADTIATEGLAAGMALLNTQFTALLIKIWPFVAGAIAVGAAIYGIIKGFQKMKESSPEAQLEKQKKVTEDLGKAYEEAKNKANNLNDTISKFKDNEDALSKLTKGSQEFSKALEENKALAQDLISTCNLDVMDWYYDENGAFHLTPSGEEKVKGAKEKTEQAVKIAEVAKSLGQYQTQQMTNSKLLSEAGSSEHIGAGTSEDFHNTFGEIYMSMKAQGEDNLEHLANFNKLVKAAGTTTLEGLQEYVNTLSDEQKKTYEGGLQYFKALKKTGLNDETKNYMASAGIQGQEWNTFKAVTEVSRGNAKSMSQVNSEFLASAANLNPEVAKIMRQAQQYDIDITKDIGPAITDAIAKGRTEISKMEDATVKQKYVNQMGYSIDGEGKIIDSDNKEVEISIDQMREVLAETYATQSKDFVTSLQEAMSAPLEERKADLFNESYVSSGLDPTNKSQQTQMQIAAGAVDDWSDPTELQTFIETLQLLGVSLPEEQLDAFIQKMQELTGVAEEADSGVDPEKQQAAEDVITAEKNLDAAIESDNTTEIVNAKEKLQEAKEAYNELIDEDLNEEITALKLDQEAIEETTDYLMENAEALDDVSDSLKDNKIAAKEVAKELARYGRAVEDVSKNYEDWKKVLKDKDLNKMPGVMKELSKSYGDLLDLDGSLLSDQFLQNSENLDLMNQAINGVDGAYEELLNRAQDDMLQLKVDPNSQAELYNELNTLSDNIRDSIKDVEVGAELNDEGFLQSLTDLVNAAGMTADEATEYLSSMGIDAEVVENKSEIEGTDKANSIRADIVDRGNINVPVIASDGSVEDRQVPIQGVNYSLVSDTADNKKEVGAPSLKVTSAKKSSGGGFKRSHGGGGGGGKGGGGGGGGGGSKKTKEAPKADRGARYHNVTQRQSNNSRRQTENNRKKDRAFGKAQVELAREDLEIQKKKIELQEEYTKEISKNLKEDREEMKRQFDDLKLPINFEFDEDGEIKNYQDVIDALFEKEKALVDQYNAGGLDDEAFDEAKKKLDEAKEALGNYEETLELQKDELQTLAEYMEELSDKALELTEIKFELNMSVIEDQLEWLDYSLEKLEDDAYGAAKAIGLMGQQTAQYLKQSENAQNAINEILGRHGIDSIEQLNGLSDSQIEALGFNKDEIEALKKYRSKLYESNQALLEMRRTMTDRVIDTFDTFNEKVQESYEEFDKYNDILEKYNDIVDLLGIKTDSATKRLIKTLRETQLQNLRNQSTSAKEIYEGAVANYDLAKKQYEDAVTRYGATSIQAQQTEEIMKNAQEAMEEGYSNWLDSYQAALEKANEIYEEAMEDIAKDFEASLTNIYGTFDLFDAAYERAKELKDDYIPEYEKIYELNKLNRDIQKEIDNSSSLRDRKALRQLQEEINRKQEAGVQLSKYEVEEMRKKFELEQARMNLEDARNNKSEVRLTRDQNGNWGYVYTAAEDKVADAEQKYEDALYNYQKLSDDYINDLDEKIKDLTRNTQERLDEVSEALKNGLITADQAALQRQEILNTFYTQQNYLISQFKGATDSLSSSLGLMNDLYGRQAELVDTFPETVFGQVSGAGSLEEWANKSSSAVLKYAEEGAQAYSTLQETNQKIAEENKMALSDIETATNNIAKASEVAQEKVTSAIKALTDNFGSALGALQTWDETYGKTIADAIGKNELFIQSLNDVIGKLATIASYEMKDLYDYIDYLSAKGAKGETITEEEWKKLDEIRSKYATNYSKESMAPFDTGGYTGEWGDEGKIAILHEKEYVLNADLTARFFDALKTFSLIESSINAKEQIQAQVNYKETLDSLNHYIDQLANYMNTTSINPNDFSASLLDTGNQQLEQNVHIDANFPNVTSHDEIEMAFDNLVNKASQYINRKNMSSMTFQDSYLSPV